MMSLMAFKTIVIVKSLLSGPTDLFTNLFHDHLVSLWHLPFSALSVISNRSSPLHCDTGGWPEWMDLLLALGEYDNGRFGVPSFGYTFKYNLGTIIALSYKIFQHGATCEGNRAAIAFYMRDNVLNQLGLTSGTWLQQADYQNLIPLGS
jgi:hypothetical protein